MRRENQLGGGVSASQSGVKKATRKHSQGSGEDSEVRRAIHHWNEQNPLDRSKGYFMVREEKTPSVHKDYDGFCREMYTDFGNGEKLDPFEIYVRENKLNKRTEIWRVVGEYREWLENQSAAYCQEARQSAPEVREVPTLAPVATVAPATTQRVTQQAIDKAQHEREDNSRMRAIREDLEQATTAAQYHDLREWARCIDDSHKQRLTLAEIDKAEQRQRNATAAPARALHVAAD